MAESGGLENRCRGNPPTEGSNPSPSAAAIVTLIRPRAHTIAAKRSDAGIGLLSNPVMVAPDVAPAARTPCCYAFVYRGVT